MSKKVFKTLVASSLLVFSAFSVSSCIVMVPYGTQGEEGDVVESDITAINITNKEDLVAEWHAGDASRKIEATLEGVEMGLLNATIQGYVVIESSAPEIVEVSGLNLIAKAEGNAVITLRASKCSTFIALKIEPAINNTMKLADIKSKIVAGELKDKDAVEFNGYITGLINKSEDQLYNGVWVQDGDAAIQLYAGNISDVFKATPDLFTIGNKVHVKGTLSPYNGLNEVKPTEITLVEDDTLIAPTTLALTGDNFNADDLAGKDGQLVSAARLIYAGADHPVVSDTVAAKKHTTLNFKLEKSDKSLVDCDVYVNYHIGDEALGALKAIAANLVAGDIVSVDGLLSWYNKPQITFGELANGKKPGDCMVITGEKYTFADPESITITSKDDATKVLVGKTLQLTASVLPASAVQTVTWSSSNPEVATVSDKGVVKGIKAGEVTITATSTAKADVKQEFVLSVEEEEKPEYGPQLVTGAPVVGTEYILGLVHDKNAETYYATGVMDGFYYATSTDYTEAGKVGFIAVEGGFSMTMTTAAGTKYMNIIKNGNYTNVVYEDAASSVWKYNADNNAMTTVLDETTYFLGTNNTKTYKTLSACTSFDGSYVARLYSTEGITPVDPEPDPVEPTAEPQLIETEPSVQTDYIIGLVHEKNQETYYLTGAMDSFYYATTTDYTAAGTVRVVEVEGGFNMTMTVGDSTKYMNIIKSGTHINVVYEDTASSVWSYDADHNTMTTVLEETTYFLGTNNTKTYKTISPCSDFDGSYVARFYTLGEATPVEPGGPVDPEPAEEGDVQTVEILPANYTEMSKAASFDLNTDDLTINISNGMIKSNHFRFYKNQTISFEGATIKEVKFECTASGTEEYGPSFLAADVGTYAYEGAVGTWTGEASKVIFNTNAGQVRASKITVKYVLVA